MCLIIFIEIKFGISDYLSANKFFVSIYFEFWSTIGFIVKYIYRLLHEWVYVYKCVCI